ncbi:MAG: sigma-54-dependent Fis family transcriptional regulator [Spirochaetales bacterium]|nr:sigma-54-dependent Fis family transcriptional regulator [Spirochaetales bacterium]
MLTVDCPEFQTTLIDRDEERSNPDLSIGTDRQYYCKNLKHPGAFSDIITQSRVMMDLFRYTESIADSTEPVLITGETGVGKELFSRAIYLAGDSKGSFIAVNVAGIDDLSFSDTLFGHRKGAFTGALDSRQGLLQQAQNGTLLLDEVGDLSQNSQIKLLRLIDNGEYYPLGLDTPVKSNARIIAASNRNLGLLVKSGHFRKDLYYRLSTHVVGIPPLRERKEDISLLFEHFVQKTSREYNYPVLSWSPGFIYMLKSYPFPGNVRELRAMTVDATHRSQSGLFYMEAIQNKIKSASEYITKKPKKSSLANETMFSCDLPLPSLKQIKKQLIGEALKRTEGNQSLAACMLGISRQALNKRLCNGQWLN